MTTDPNHPDTPPTAPDPMSDGEPMGASDRVESLPDAEPLPRRVPPPTIAGPPPPYGHTVDPLAGEHVNCSHDSMGQDPLKAMICSPMRVGPAPVGVDIYSGESAPLSPPRCEKHAEGCTRTPVRGMPTCWQHTPPAYRPRVLDVSAPAPGPEDRVDRQERRRILDRLDVDPWRLPIDGLLEYDPVHDEWRVELYTKAGVGGPLSRVIVRRYAGRRRYARGGPVDLTSYLAGGRLSAGDGRITGVADRVMFYPTPEEIEQDRRIYEAIDAARTARDYLDDRRMRVATRPRDWPHRVDESGQVVSFKTGDTYQAAEMFGAAAEVAVRLQDDGAVPAAALLARLEVGRRGHRA